MTAFEGIPTIIIEYLREVFARANDKVTRQVASQPFTHEETLDQALVTELQATAPRFFAEERAGVLIESHWLGGRHMYDRWEIADIAFFITVRRAGHLESRKVALLQTKRLYADGYPSRELEFDDFAIGIGRLADVQERTIPFSARYHTQFTAESIYGALRKASEQVGRIAAYEQARSIPVYYGLYHPPKMPFSRMLGAGVDDVTAIRNDLGIRVMRSSAVHSVLSTLEPYEAPTFQQLSVSTDDIKWRLEDFIADEVMRCREGKLFDGAQDPNLQYLLYRRSAPIQAAISITIDLDASLDIGATSA